MRRIFRNIAAIIVLAGMLPVAIPSAAMAARPTVRQDSGVKKDAKDAGKDVKDAGKDTGKAAKKAGSATKKGTKKGVNKAAEKTKEGAGKVEEKTEPNQ